LTEARKEKDMTAVPLTTFYRGWASYQQNLVAMIAPLSPEQLALRPSSNHWSIGMIAQHIIGNRVWWFQIWMGEGNMNLAPIAHWDPQDKEWQGTLSAPELVAGLESTWQMIEDALAHWTPADLEYVVLQPTALNEEDRELFFDLTRRWIIWHVLEHEIHHGGELSFALGMYGLVGIYG
jgi:uncharacterized damage-inducible protein DinB